MYKDPKMNNLELYMRNKKKYLDLQTFGKNVFDVNDDDDDEQKNKIITGPLTTYMLTMGSSKQFPGIKLTDVYTKPIKINKIGSFEVGSKVVIGDTDYEVLKLKPGKYTAYELADSLMIINDELGIMPDQNEKLINDWTWKHSGKGVGVDTGSFGFYDLDTIHKIKGGNIRENDNDLPILCVGAGMVDGSAIDEIDSKRNPSLKNLKPFGVKADTIIGDGGFECYVIGDDRAILLGGEASIALDNCQ